jgi:hypothetical protein
MAAKRCRGGIKQVKMEDEFNQENKDTYLKGRGAQFNPRNRFPEK